MAINENEVVSFIKNLRLCELKPLIQTLERELGVSAQSPALPYSYPSNPPRPGPELEPLFDLVLLEPGPRRLETMRVLRELLGLGLREARDLADRPNAVVREGALASELRELFDRLVQAGARAELREARETSER